MKGNQSIIESFFYVKFSLGLTKFISHQWLFTQEDFLSKSSIFLSSLWPCQSSYATSARPESRMPKSPLKFQTAKPIFFFPSISRTSANHAKKTSCGVLFQQPHSPQ